MRPYIPWGEELRSRHPAARPKAASASDRIAKNRQFGLCRFDLIARKENFFPSANVVQGQQCTGGMKNVKMGGLVPWRAPREPLKIDSLH
jgi:hypothetical protein